MNDSLRAFGQRALYAVGANVVALIVSIGVTLMVPKVVGIDDYGYWQLYLFAASYVGVLHLGWIDGMQLVHGGASYSDLSRPVFSSMFWIFFCVQTFMSLIIAAWLPVISLNSSYRVIWIFIALTAALTNIRSFFVGVLQMTNRIRESSLVLILDRVIFCLGVALALGFGARDFRHLITADLAAKVFAIGMGAIFCRDLIFVRPGHSNQVLPHAVQWLRAGLSLLISNFAAMLTLGIVRLEIERSWDIVTFGQASLALGIVSLFLTMFGALGVVAFPALRRVQTERLPLIYSAVCEFHGSLALVTMWFVFPVRYLLGIWLPDYHLSLSFLGLVLPIALFESRIQMIVSPYLKTLRRERFMMLTNLTMVLISGALTLIASVYVHSLVLTISCIPVVSALRCLVFEHYLARTLNVSVTLRGVLEVVIVCAFVFLANYVPSGAGVAAYGGVCVAILLWKRDSFRNGVARLRS